MKLVLQNYALLGTALVLAAIAAIFRPAGFPEPWLSMLSLGLTIAAACRLLGRRADALTGEARWHASAQKRVLLLCLVASVVSSLQWIIIAKHDAVEGFLQMLDWTIYAAIWLILALAGVRWRMARKGAAEPTADGG